MPSASSDLTNKIIDYLYRYKVFSWRAESIGLYDKTKAIMRTAPKKGVADILACYKGYLIAVEVKIGTDRQSPEQEGFQKNIEHTGGQYFIAKDFKSFEEWWLITKQKIDSI